MGPGGTTAAEGASSRFGRASDPVLRLRSQEEKKVRR
jgi:hypothetical protein